MAPKTPHSQAKQKKTQQKKQSTASTSSPSHGKQLVKEARKQIQRRGRKLIT